ncbi:MAG TPA: carbonic anhydrase family protein [Silvibacterium sp.]|nr:carbonic anhydrase family protein [Silvibacterium sp.]
MRIPRYFAFVLTVLAVGWNHPASTQQHQPGHEWGYDGSEGPKNWGDLNPKFAPCKTGHRQSPIDIRNARKADLPAIEFMYKTSPLDIIDNGHTIMLNYAPGSFIRVGSTQYQLKQFHFHRPSEEKINGRTYDMVVHLVHANQEGNLAVVAVLLQQGTDNQLVRELWNALPAEKDKEEMHQNIRIDVNGILPADKGYYTFQGSLTTPPCSEGVTWFVLKQPVTVSEAEIAQFSRLYRDDARPTQPAYGREILESK